MITLLQFDDFAPDALEVREAVIEGGFSTEEGPDGFKYTGISQYQASHWFELVSKAIGRPITPRLSCFRINYSGELPHAWVHNDKICAKYASVLYLSLQSAGGTAFWRHIGLNADRMPSREELVASGIDPDWFYSMMDRECRDLTFWEQDGFVAMKFNRFITYPTEMFHSRYPFQGFGSKPEDGRLYWACFYD